LRTTFRDTRNSRQIVLIGFFYSMPIHIDNYATHEHAKVRAWLNQHPRFRLPLHPDLGRLAQCGRGLLRQLTKHRLKRSVFRLIVDLRTAINRFLRETNDDPTPAAIGSLSIQTSRQRRIYI
jgi:hypothetical protein